MMADDDNTACIGQYVSFTSVISHFLVFVTLLSSTSTAFIDELGRLSSSYVSK